MKRPWIRPAVTLLLLGCGHSDAFAPDVPTVGPAGSSSDVRLTFNTEQDDWPMWTQDGRGILYSFVEARHAQRQCIGLLPAAGGRLLYVEAAASVSSTLTPSEITLWLADTVAPFARAALLTLPEFVGSNRIGWLSDMAWTGPNTFIALGQDFSVSSEPVPPCNFAEDSIFADPGAMVVGTITSNHATLQLVSGTTGATGYSLAENGASIVFTLRDDLRLFEVPLLGGTRAPMATVSTATGTRLLGLSCKVSTCLVANDAVALLPLFHGLLP